MANYELAKAIICGLPTSELIDVWENTTTIDDPCTPMVRGWIMDEFEKRDFEGFNAWLESDECDDYKLRSYLIKEV